MTEGETTFDIRFTAYAPTTGEPIKLIINIEAQIKVKPGYSLIKRAIFHGSRLMVFRAKLNATEKKDRLKSDYGIEMDNEALKEVNVMCNLGEGLVEETREETWEEATLTHLKNIMEAMGVSLEKAMDILKVPVDSRSMYASMIS